MQLFSSRYVGIYNSIAFIIQEEYTLWHLVLLFRHLYRLFRGDRGSPIEIC